MQKRTQGWIGVVMGGFIVVVRLLGIGPELGAPGAYGAFRTGGFVGRGLDSRCRHSLLAAGVVDLSVARRTESTDGSFLS